MNRLLTIGFEPAGHWLLEGDKLKFELTRHAMQKNILYAFVCDGEVKYVGKTVRALAARMAGYKNPGPTQSTNINNNRRIRELLAGDVAIEIYALPDSGLLHYGQFHLNLAAGLEDDIIKVLNPEWNGGASEGSLKPQIGNVEGEVAPLPEANSSLSFVNEFSFTLQPTYYRTGFFNVGVDVEKYLGADGEKIELFLGNSSEPVLGTINRRANKNGTPRIMGGTDLRDWFNNNAEVLKSIRVGVLSPTSIRLMTS